MAENVASAKRGAKLGRRRWLGRLSRVVWPERVATDFAELPTFLTGPRCRLCTRPVEIDLGRQTVCAPCTADPPPWSEAGAPLAYDDTTRAMILSFKHGGRRESLASFGRWMAREAGEMLETADLLVPVPLHALRLAGRGFNQSVWLAASVSKVSGVPMAVHALKRRRRTVSQGGLNGTARARNVTGAFSVSNRARKRLAGRRVILIDDVYTTGATLVACARELKRAGVSHISVLVLARVVRDEHVTI